MKRTALILATALIFASCGDEPTPIDGRYKAQFSPEFPGTPADWTYNLTFDILTIGEDSVNCIATATLTKGSTISELDWVQSQGQRTGNQMKIVFGTLDFNTQNFELRHSADRLTGDYYRQYTNEQTIVTTKVTNDIQFNRVE